LFTTQNLLLGIVNPTYDGSGNFSGYFNVLLEGNYVINQTFASINELCNYFTDATFDLGDYSTVSGLLDVGIQIGVTTDAAGSEFSTQLILGNATLGSPLPPDADFQEDGDVDENDLDTWQDNYGACCTIHTEGDSDWDGDVDGRDFLNWQRQYTGNLNPLIANLTVPEPSVIFMLMPFILQGALLRTRHQRYVGWNESFHAR
jgi:hypothetical protein